MQLSEATWADAAAVETDLALLPVGSTEQHGPHAPLGTDALTAKTVAAAGADAYDGDVVVAPPVQVGIAAEHRRFPGTLWVSEDTFREYVRETAESLVAGGWDRVIVVNGHGGNIAALREVCAGMTRESDAYAVPFTWFDAVSFEAAGDDPPVDLTDVAMGHGGAVETSLVRAVAPELVHPERFEEARDGGSAGWGEWHGSVNLAYDTDEFSDSGTVGDPGASDPALGEWLRERAADKLASLLGRVENRPSENEADSDRTA
jgi:creatinine amidohydrolase